MIASPEKRIGLILAGVATVAAGYLAADPGPARSVSAAGETPTGTASATATLIPTRTITPTERAATVTPLPTKTATPTEVPPTPTPDARATRIAGERTVLANSEKIRDQDQDLLEIHKAQTAVARQRQVILGLPTETNTPTATAMITSTPTVTSTPTSTFTPTSTPTFTIGQIEDRRRAGIEPATSTPTVVPPGSGSGKANEGGFPWGWVGGLGAVLGWFVIGGKGRKVIWDCIESRFKPPATPGAGGGTPGTPPPAGGTGTP